MKKTFLFSMALVAALSSCTKDSAIENDNNNGTNLDLNPNAPVAIQLGAGSNISAGVEEMPKSRGVVNAWDNTKIGIFALSKAGDWNAEQVASDPTVLWNNVEGTVNTENHVTNFVLGNQPGYYPNQGTLNYSFYGYCLTDDPTTIAESWAAPTINPDGNVVTVTHAIDGTDDILWGKAEAKQLNGIGEDSENTYDGYNAKYFRKGDGAATPSMAFGHLLTQLQFNVNKSASYEGGQTLYLRSITVKAVDTNLDLTIADVSGTNGEGKLTVNADAKNKDLTVSNIAANGIAIADLDALKPAGDPIMLYTDGATTNTFEIEVVLAGGTEPDSPKSTNKLTITAPNSGIYEIGTAYKVNLTINSLESIDLDATVAKWLEEETPIEGEI